MMQFNIPPLTQRNTRSIQSKIDLKTKPIGALGKLESIALQLCQIQDSLEPKLIKPTIAIFASDHGIAKDGVVNPYPQEVTYQMVMNFLQGGAAVCVFAKQHQIALKVVDAGVNYDFSYDVNNDANDSAGLIDAKVAMGTKNYLQEPAMTTMQCQEAISTGASIVEDIINQGSNCIGFGEMGIGNTSSSALLMSALCQLPIEQCVGNGTGTDKAQFQQKLAALKQAQALHDTRLKTDQQAIDPIEVLATFGGFEIAQMCGGMLKAAEHKVTILVDGFISSAALLVAQQINPHVLDYAICTHQSDESGHQAMLAFMKKEALIDIGMRLGEGSGIAVAFPLLVSACQFMNDMASFESAAVSQQS